MVSAILPIFSQVVGRFPRVASVAKCLQVGKVQPRSTCYQWHNVVHLRGRALLADLANRMSAANHQRQPLPRCIVSAGGTVAAVAIALRGSDRARAGMPRSAATTPARRTSGHKKGPIRSSARRRWNEQETLLPTCMIPRGDGHRLLKMQRCIIINAWQKPNHPLRRRRQSST